MEISYHASSLLASRSPKKQNTETNLISREKKKLPNTFVFGRWHGRRDSNP